MLTGWLDDTVVCPDKSLIVVQFLFQDFFTPFKFSFNLSFEILFKLSLQLSSCPVSSSSSSPWGSPSRSSFSFKPFSLWTFPSSSPIGSFQPFLPLSNLFLTVSLSIRLYTFLLIPLWQDYFIKPSLLKILSFVIGFIPLLSNFPLFNSSC